MGVAIALQVLPCKIIYLQKFNPIFCTPLGTAISKNIYLNFTILTCTSNVTKKDWTMVNTKIQHSENLCTNFYLMVKQQGKMFSTRNSSKVKPTTAWPMKKRLSIPPLPPMKTRKKSFPKQQHFIPLHQYCFFPFSVAKYKSQQEMGAHELAAEAAPHCLWVSVIERPLYYWEDTGHGALQATPTSAPTFFSKSWFNTWFNLLEIFI